jgi:hypothetical protein
VNSGYFFNCQRKTFLIVRSSVRIPVVIAHPVGPPNVVLLLVVPSLYLIPSWDAQRWGRSALMFFGALKSLGGRSPQQSHRSQVLAERLSSILSHVDNITVQK